MLPSKVRPLPSRGAGGGSAHGVRHLLGTNLSSSLCDVGQIMYNVQISVVLCYLGDDISSSKRGLLQIGHGVVSGKHLIERLV